MRGKLLSGLKIERYWIAYALLFVLYVMLIPKTGHMGDVHTWQQWAMNNFVYGLPHAYTPSNYHGTDYLPLFHYFLYLFGLIQGSVENIEKNIHVLKIIPLIFEFIGGIVLIKLLDKKYKNESDVFFFSLVLFFNIAYFYNSMIWGQVDGMMTTLVLLSFYYGLKEKILRSVVFILLALSFKIQSIIFIPVLGLILLPGVIHKFSWRNLAAWILVPSAMLALIVLPFARAGDLDKIWNLILSYSGHYPVVSMNAYNMWYWFLGNSLMDISDESIFAGLTYKNWGLLLFCLASFAALFPLLQDIYKKVIKRENSDFNTQKIFLIGALIPLIFFFFNTEMHERYSHPAIIFTAVYSILTGRYLPYFLVSLAYLLNMEAVLKFLGFHNYGIVPFSPQFVAAIYLLTILLLFFDLYKQKYISRVKEQVKKPVLFVLKPESRLQIDYAKNL